MSRTARCMLALGFSVTLAAACGDDADVIDGVGGTAGASGASGSAGSAGRGGSAGSAGTAGRGGSAGSTAGRGGTGNGGAAAGTGGTDTGTGGTDTGTGGTDVVPDDAGVDASPDGGDVVVVDAALPDSGVNGDCPAFSTAIEDNNQGVVIARVLFRAGTDGATVVFRGTGAGNFNFADPMQLCSTAADGDCLDVGGLDSEDNLLQVGQEVSVFVNDVLPDEGELALLSDLPTAVGTFAFGYIAWGDTFISDAPAAGDPETLEERAVSANVWTEDARITVGATQNTIVGDGDTTDEDGFQVCTGDGDF